MAIVTRLGKGSKLTIEEMDNNLLSLETDISGNVSSITSKLDKGSYTGSAKDLENAIAANVTLIASKLDKGAYTGTAKDLENAITAAVTGASGISIVPTSAAPAGTGIASFTATQAGTYTNYGGVVVTANSFAIISRSATGVFSISQTALDISSKANVSDVVLKTKIVNNLNSIDITEVAAAPQLKILNDKFLTKADLVVGKNLFNPLSADIITGSFLNSSGVLQANSSYSITGFIEIKTNTAYFCNKTTYNLGSHYCFYDLNKNFISASNTIGTLSPANAAFIRLSLQMTTLFSTAQVEEGSVATTLEAYAKKVPLKDLNIPSYVEIVEYLGRTSKFTETSTLTNASIDSYSLADAVKEIYLIGTEQICYISIIKNQSGGQQYIKINNSSDVEICRYLLTSNFLTGVQTLPLIQFNNSGVTGFVVFDWSKITVGANITMTSTTAILKSPFSKSSLQNYTDYFKNFKEQLENSLLLENSPFLQGVNLAKGGNTSEQIVNSIKGIYLQGNVDINASYRVGDIWRTYTYLSKLYYNITITRDSDNVIVCRYLSPVQFDDSKIQVLYFSEINASGINGTVAVDFSKLNANSNINFGTGIGLITNKIFDFKTLNYINTFKESKFLSKTYGVSDFGNVDYNDSFSTDYIELLSYGQSLSVGARTSSEMTTTAYPDTFMVGNRVLSSPEYQQDGTTVFNPLVSNKFSWFAEPPIITATNAFKMMFDRYHRFGYQKKFIASACGQGGKSIELLSKTCTNTTSGTTADNYYNLNFKNHLLQVKATADGLGKTVSCVFIDYMQGESNYSGTGQGLTTGSNQTLDKAVYKAYLLQLKNDMQAEIISIYGQTKKPLFRIYQTGGVWIKTKEQAVTTAQIEFANENEDVILGSPIYPMPRVSDGHLTANGSRIYGNFIAKDYFNILLKNKKANIVLHKEVIISGSTININYQVPTPPLVFDTYTFQKALNFGFNVYTDGVLLTIANVEIINSAILITCGTILKGVVEVTYAGLNSGGAGNLRDSDEWVTLYDYLTDSATEPAIYTPTDKDGVSILNKKMPQYNFASHMYHKETII
jgi:hypothetical protein